MAKKNKKIVLLSSIVGNILEFYDLALFGFLAPIIAHLFFPMENLAASMLLTLGTFSLGFLTRPLGAIIFGYIGDRHGRKKSLLTSIILMSIPTVCIGILPTYEVVGVWAAILITVCRLLQGICVGGEYNGSIIFYLEHTSTEKRNFHASLMGAAAILGFLMASLVSLICVQSWVPSWGWRIPFFMGGIIGLLGIFVRKYVTETPRFEENKKEGKIKNQPIRYVFSNHMIAALCTIGIGGFLGAINLTLFGYMTMYLVKTIKISMQDALVFSSLSILFLVILTPIMGYIADRGHAMKIMFFSTGLTFLVIFPIFSLLIHGAPWSILTGLFCLSFLAACILSTCHPLMYALFPTFGRYSGVSFNFSIGVAVIGGGAPILTSMIVTLTGKPLFAAFYIFIASIVGFISLYVIQRKKLLKYELL